MDKGLQAAFDVFTQARTSIDGGGSNIDYRVKKDPYGVLKFIKDRTYYHVQNRLDDNEELDQNSFPKRGLEVKVDDKNLRAVYYGGFWVDNDRTKEHKQVIGKININRLEDIFDKKPKKLTKSEGKLISDMINIYEYVARSYRSSETLQYDNRPPSFHSGYLGPNRLYRNLELAYEALAKLGVTRKIKLNKARKDNLHMLLIICSGEPKFFDERSELFKKLDDFYWGSHYSKLKKFVDENKAQLIQETLNYSGRMENREEAEQCIDLISQYAGLLKRD